MQEEIEHKTVNLAISTTKLSARTLLRGMQFLLRQYDKHAAQEEVTVQEEIEHKTVNLAISTTKLSARTLLRGMQFLLRQYDKHASQGKQSMKRLVRQNRGVTNVEIQKTGIKDFDRYAKRYHIDYSIQKDLSCTPPRYLVYFKAQDTDALSAAFKEYSASVLDKTKRPSVLAKLHDLAQSVANLPDKVRHKQEERGL